MNKENKEKGFFLFWRKSHTSIVPLGSSETIRETSFDFVEYNKFKPPHKKNINKTFLEWFVGFSEGDGSFIESKDRLFFIINQKEVKILRTIRTNLGFGKVSIYNGYGRYVVADRENIDRLIYIFNGNLLLNKTNNRFLNWVKVRNRYSSNPILYKKRVKKLNTFFVFSNNSWLAGFIDAEGCFNCDRKRSHKYKIGFTISLRFILDQKDELLIFEEIKSFLGSGSICEPLPIKGMYRFVTTNKKSHQKLFCYLKNYPLRSIKKVSFLRFCSLSRFVNNRSNYPLTEKGLQRVERLISELGKKDVSTNREIKT